MAKNQWDATFAREFRKLNSAQREAVESIEGPLMIVAGPGTGKTQVVALRIGRILQKSQLNARNVLALTFTEAGVTALQKRLERLMGPDAYQVTIATFHSFANEVVSTFPYLFGFATEATQTTDLERLQIIHRLIDKNEHLRALRPVRTPTFHVRSVGDSIRKLKQENIASSDLRQLARDQYGKAASKETPAAAAARQRQLDLNLELAEVYQMYQAELALLGKYDYEDMILFALKALREEVDVKGYYQERYQYVLVDEYQDTNNAQNGLVEALVDFFESPNVCVVGDDKQAIYRFQGASVANMMHFAKRFPDAKIVSLRENYRSLSPILATADRLIANNHHQLANVLPGVESKLTAVRPLGNGAKPELVRFASEESEFGWIVGEISSALIAGQPVGELAVLTRTNEAVKRFRAQALRSGLPLAGSETTDLASEPVVQQLMGLLQAVAQPLQMRLVVPALRNVAPLSPLLLARYAASQGKHRSVRGDTSISKQERAQINQAMKIFLTWVERAQDGALPDVVQSILCESLILTRIQGRLDQLEQLELLKRFITEVRQYSLAHPSAKLGAFLDYILLLRDYRLRLSIPRLLPSQSGVYVGTAHSAKGLEFGTVFLPGVTKKVWSGRASRELIKLPSLIVASSEWHEDPLEDERRLFYVALTRAKDRLVCSLTATDSDGREVLPSQFVSELGDTLNETAVTVSRSEAEELIVNSFQPISRPTLQEQELRLIRELVSERPFSFTDYKTYQLCPRQYLLSSLLRFPSKTEPRLVYGSLLHRALELFFKKYRSTKKIPSPATLQSFISQAAKGVEPFAGRSAIISQATELLNAYHPILREAAIPVGVEYSLTNHHVLLEDIWVTGKFDRIDPIDATARTVRIIDYKTGSQAKTRNDIEGKTKSSDGRLREQLVFYSLLTSLDRHFPYIAAEFSLLFLDDAHTFREETFRVGADEREALGRDVATTYREILSQTEFNHTRTEFDRGCEVCELFRDLS